MCDLGVQHQVFIIILWEGRESGEPVLGAVEETCWPLTERYMVSLFSCVNKGTPPPNDICFTVQSSKTRRQVIFLKHQTHLGQLSTSKGREPNHPKPDTQHKHQWHNHNMARPVLKTKGSITQRGSYTHIYTVMLLSQCERTATYKTYTVHWRLYYYRQRVHW